MEKSPANKSSKSSNSPKDVSKAMTLAIESLSDGKGSANNEWTKDDDEVLLKAVQRACRKMKRQKGHQKFELIDWKQLATEHLPQRQDTDCRARYEALTGIRTLSIPWTKEEDRKLVELVQTHGACKWTSFTREIPGRSGKQCRERWHNHVNPDVFKSRVWSPDEDRRIIQLHSAIGNKWSEIAKTMKSGRTDNAIKNHFYSYLRCRIEKYLIEDLQMDEKDIQDDSGRYLIPYGRLDECCRAISKMTPAVMKGANKKTASSRTRIKLSLSKKPAATVPTKASTKTVQGQGTKVAPFRPSLLTTLPPVSAMKRKAEGKVAPSPGLAPQAQKKLKVDQPSSLEMEQLGKYLSKLKGGFLPNGVYLSALERQKYAKNLKIAETGNIEDLRKLNLCLPAEGQYLPHFFKEALFPNRSSGQNPVAFCAPNVDAMVPPTMLARGSSIFDLRGSKEIARLHNGCAPFFSPPPPRNVARESWSSRRISQLSFQGASTPTVQWRPHFPGLSPLWTVDDMKMLQETLIPGALSVEKQNRIQHTRVQHPGAPHTGTGTPQPVRRA